ncbi:hypothetical protein WDU94_001552 [Cyamophila willieti]
MTVFKDEADISGIVIRNAFKSYGSHAVLKGLNLTVQKSTIYGLLGPSGCGKTTLLSCIVKRLSLDHGSISLTAKSVSDIGYMPQDVCLHTELSIKEIFYYYGYIYGLTDKQIKFKMAELLSFLELPNQNRICTELSGGQQRRVSFAVSLLHDPKILILDEPTVGLDPVLSYTIWQRLLEMSRMGKTIVITTHYIEEAKQADAVGLMRNGALLAEDSPSYLLQYYNSSSLEDVFLYLCEQDQNNNAGNKTAELPSSCDKLRSLPNIEQTTSFTTSRFSSHRFKAQVIKNLYQIRRNVEITLFMLFLPIVICVFFNLAIGHDPTNLTVAYVNEESYSCYNVTYKGCALTERIYASCQVLDEMREKTFNLVQFNSTEDAQLAMFHNHVWGVIYFAPNYTQSVVNRINMGQHTKAGTLDSGAISFWIDKSDKYISSIVSRDVVTSLLDTISKILAPCSSKIKVSSKIMDNPIKFNQAIYGNNEPTFQHFATPAAIIICIFYLPVIFTGAIINSEKEGGVIERVMAAGMSFFEVAIAHSAVQSVLMIFQAIEMMILMYIVYDNPYKGNILTGLALLVLVGCGGSVFGFILAVLSKNLAGACFFGIGSNFLLMCVCGFIWPAEGAHYLLRLINSYFPLTLATTAMRSISNRGWGVTHPVIYMGFVSAGLWLAVFISLAYLVLRIRDDIWRSK